MWNPNPNRTIPFLVLLAAFALQACAGAPRPSPYQVRNVREISRFAVQRGGQQLGYVVSLVIEDPAGGAGVQFFRVENQAGQWVGEASTSGRFTRRVPFRDEGEDLGIHPMAVGVAKLFDVSSVTLEKVDPEAPGAGAQESIGRSGALEAASSKQWGSKPVEGR